MKNFFHIFNLNLPSLKPLPLVLSLQALVKSLSPSFLEALFIYWKAAIRSPYSLLWRLNSPKSLSNLQGYSVIQALLISYRHDMSLFPFEHFVYYWREECTKMEHKDPCFSFFLLCSVISTGELLGVFKVSYCLHVVWFFNSHQSPFTDDRKWEITYNPEKHSLFVCAPFTVTEHSQGSSAATCRWLNPFMESPGSDTTRATLHIPILLTLYPECNFPITSSLPSHLLSFVSLLPPFSFCWYKSIWT